MKQFCFIFLMSILLMFISGCVSVDEKVDPNILKSSDEKALYDLMVARGNALNAKDMDMFRQIYTKDSPELEWIKNTGIPMWKENGMNFNPPSLRKISIIGNDAAASFTLNGENSYGTSFFYRVEVLYVKEDSQWKIESTGAR
jgi:hypothetical protein